MINSKKTIDPRLYKQLMEKTTPSKKMSIDEIIEKDIKTNYKDTDISKKEALEIINGYKNRGATVKKVNNTIFIFFDKNQEVEYHTINGDSTIPFLYNCLVFFSFLKKQGKTVAKTYFTDEKTKKLVEKYKLPNEEIVNSDNPSKGKFLLVTYLTGSA